MANDPPTYYIQTDRGHKYLVDWNKTKKFWLMDDDRLALPDGREQKKGYLKKHHSGNWYEVHWYNKLVAYVEK